MFFIEAYSYLFHWSSPSSSRVASAEFAFRISAHESLNNFVENKIKNPSKNDFIKIAKNYNSLKAVYMNRSELKSDSVVVHI